MLRESVIGVDEAGRGSWAGPLAAAAVRLRGDWSAAGLDDSKRLLPAERQRLAGQLRRRADVGLAFIEAREIDIHGLSWAQREAMRQAVACLRPAPDELIIVDGKVNYLKDFYAASRAVIKADGKYPAVMAASIVAKVDRDRLMLELDGRYPGYFFGRHKGYGTKLHLQALRQLGALRDIHRLSYRPLAALTRS